MRRGKKYRLPPILRWNLHYLQPDDDLWTYNLHRALVFPGPRCFTLRGGCLQPQPRACPRMLPRRQDLSSSFLPLIILVAAVRIAGVANVHTCVWCRCCKQETYFVKCGVQRCALLLELQRTWSVYSACKTTFPNGQKNVSTSSFSWPPLDITSCAHQMVHATIYAEYFPHTVSVSCLCIHVCAYTCINTT